MMALTATPLTTFTAGTPTPLGGVAVDAAGNLFGTNAGGPTGRGYVWELPKVDGRYAASVTTIASFPADGSIGTHTRNGLVIDDDGNLYGTNRGGYAPYTAADVGTLWRVVKTNAGYGDVQLLKAFTTDGGQNPDTILSVDNANTVYGVALGQLDDDNSRVFSYSPAAGYADVATFSLSTDDRGNIGGPESNLAIDAVGNLYGTTINGGAAGAGSLYVVPAGSGEVRLIASFDRARSGPVGQISLSTAGGITRVFGAAEGDELGGTNAGLLWSADVSGVTVTTIDTVGIFDGTTNGSFPAGAFVGLDGNVYGLANAASNDGRGLSLFESVNVAGTFAVPVTVATFDDVGSFITGGLASDGTNFFGVTTSNATNGGSVVGFGPDTIPHGGSTPTPTPTGTTSLTPTIRTSTVPTTAVGNAAFRGTVSGTVVNTSGATIKGLTFVSVYAFDASGAGTLVGFQRRPVNLRDGQTTAFKVAVKKSLPTGAYTLEVVTTDPSNRMTYGTGGPALSVAAPVVVLTATGVTAVKPAVLKAGKAGAFSATITNTGNVDAVGAATISVNLTADGTTPAAAATVTSRTYKIKVGKKVVVKLRLPTVGVPAGTYQPIVSFTLDGVTASAVGAATFTVG